MSKQYSIRDLSQEFGVTTRTLRFYEEKGLLNPLRCGQSRVYSAADRTRLILVLRGKTLGLSLEESADLIAMYDPRSNNRKQLATLLHKIKARKQQLAVQQQELSQLIEDLGAWEQRTSAALQDNTSKQKRSVTTKTKLKRAHS